MVLLEKGTLSYMNNAYAAICLWSESNPNDSVKVALSQTRNEHDVDCSILVTGNEII